jgi:hypothetical protein
MMENGAQHRRQLPQAGFLSIIGATGQQALKKLGLPQRDKAIPRPGHLGTGFSHNAAAGIRL